MLLVANKVDNNERISLSSDFYKFGLGEPYCISSINGSGTGELLDALIKEFPEDHVDPYEGLPKFAIVGQPNVGKSSLLNMLTGEERSIVTPIAGTTRDSIHQRYSKYGHDFLLVDTAGLRRKANVKEDVEFYSVLRSVRVIEESDICLFMIDAEKGLTAQDLAIFHLIEVNKKGVVIIVNKWDLIEKDQSSTKDYEEYIRKKIMPFNDVPIIFISVINKQRVHKTLEIAVQIYKNKQQRIPTSQLNKVMLPIIENTPPPSLKGRTVNIKYVTQLPGRNPNFGFFCSHPQYVSESYRRFLENNLRKHFDFSGIPISIIMRNKDGSERD